MGLPRRQRVRYNQSPQDVICGLRSVGEADQQSLMEGRGRLGCDVLIFRGGSEDGRIGPEAEVVLPGPLYPEEALSGRI